MKIIDDTLKKTDAKGVLKWSRTSLTMFSAWVSALFMAFHQHFKVGFNYEVFIILVGVALGAKVTDAWSKKMINTQPPKDETTTN